MQFDNVFDAILYLFMSVENNNETQREGTVSIRDGFNEKFASNH